MDDADLTLQRAQMALTSMTAGLARDLTPPEGQAALVVKTRTTSEGVALVCLERSFAGGSVYRTRDLDLREILALARLAQVQFDPAEDEARLKVSAATPAHTRSRRGGPKTSRAAGIRVADPKNLSEVQQRVLLCHRNNPGGLTDIELQEKMGDHGSTYRTRRAELTEAGLIADSGSVRSIRGRDRIVWVATRPSVVQ